MSWPCVDLVSVLWCRVYNFSSFMSHEKTTYEPNVIVDICHLLVYICNSTGQKEQYQQENNDNKVRMMCYLL